MKDLFYEKVRNQKLNKYHSSTCHFETASLGTIESDVSGFYGRFKSEPFRGFKLANLVSELEIKTILDVGGGDFKAASFFSSLGITVDVNDFITSPYMQNNLAKLKDLSKVRLFFEGDFMNANIHNKYDLIWASHILEHIENIGDFLRRLSIFLNDNGYIAIVVPPRKPFIVSGHINLFNPGLLLYRLIISGYDCSEAKIFQYDNNICLLVKVKVIQLPQLNYDRGDLSLLKDFFPFNVVEGFNGDFMYYNLSSDELNYIYEGKI